MHGLSSILVVALLALAACRDDASPHADDAARAACTQWQEEVLANLGEEEFASSGRFLPALDEIARAAARSAVPGLATAAAEVATRARAVVVEGNAEGYEEAVRAMEAACASVGLGVR